MPVPTSIDDLSTIAANNSPLGTESPATADDYLRAHAAIIKGVGNLRPDLANSADPAKGATLVGYQGGTVAQKLTAQSQDINDLADRADAVPEEIQDALRDLPPVNRTQPLMARSNKVLSVGQGVVILGDSISAGAYFGNAYTNGWPYLLAKAINHQFGAQNIGALPMDSLYNVVPEYNTDQLHDVTWVGNWGTRASSPAPYDFPLGNVGLAAGDAVNGKTVTSTSSGAYVEFVIPSMNGIATIYYVERSGGGVLNITMNGVAQTPLDTSAASTSYNRTRTVNLTDNGKGLVTVRLTKADANPTEIQSVIKYQKSAGSPFDHFPLMNVSNYSVSGRQLARMSESGIIRATNCAALVLALGYNDRFAETDDAYYADFLQRINFVINYANINRCLVVVADFAWYSPKTSRVRTELRRVADETNGIYIPFPDKFYPDGGIVVDTSPTATALVSDLRLFADNAHPAYKGNELIFTEVARALGLSITTKRAALLNDIPYPLSIQGTFINKAGSVSTVARTTGGLAYSLGITAAGGGTIPAGVSAIVSVPAKFASGLDLRPTLSLNSTVGTAIGSTISTGASGSASAVVSTAAEVSCSYLVSPR